MKIYFEVLTKEQILNNGEKLNYIVGSDSEWKDQVLGENSKKGGVYIFHTGRKILYVGKTFKAGKWGNFNERLRRHCQSKASKNSEVYQLLKKSKILFVSLITSEEIIKSTKFHKMKMTNKGLVLTYEQILIDYLNPVYEQNKVGYKNLVKGLEKKRKDEVTLTFSEIEKIIGRKLPESSKYHTWWYPGNRPHSDYWLQNNWRVSSLNPKNKKVTFQNIS